MQILIKKKKKEKKSLSSIERQTRKDEQFAFKQEKRKETAPGYNSQLTILLAQLLLANASGFALKAKPIPSI